MIAIGSKVILDLPLTKSPVAGWGNAKNGDVGTLIRHDGENILVDFPNNKSWAGIDSEIRLVAEFPPDSLTQEEIDSLPDLVRRMERWFRDNYYSDSQVMLIGFDEESLYFSIGEHNYRKYGRIYGALKCKYLIPPKFYVIPKPAWYGVKENE